MVMNTDTKNRPKLDKQAKITMAGIVALGIGIGKIFNLVTAGFFIGLGLALLTAARLLGEKSKK